jgi:DNA-binding LacI/PurR family transcriptional regulator
MAVKWHRLHVSGPTALLACTRATGGRPPLTASGRIAAELLLQRLADPTSGPEEVLLELELIRRGTTAPPA